MNIDVELRNLPGAEAAVSCTTTDGSNPASVIEQAKSSSMVSNSISRGVLVSVMVEGA